MSQPKKSAAKAPVRGSAAAILAQGKKDARFVVEMSEDARHQIKMRATMLRLQIAEFTLLAFDAAGVQFGEPEASRIEEARAKLAANGKAFGSE